MRDCPVYWINFVGSLDSLDDEEDDYERVAFINKHLSSYSAEFSMSHSENLIFDSEEDATAFILRWS